MHNAARAAPGQVNAHALAKPSSSAAAASSDAAGPKTVALASLEGEAWLNVNLDNPAGDLYASLGFERYGVRGRWS